MSTRIIDLAEPQGQDEFPSWAAIYSPETINPFALSPGAMRWSDNIHLSRLEDCKTFWLQQKKKLRCKLNDLFDPLLRYQCGADYVAVFGHHPWQCLVYLQYQLAHQGQGLHQLQSRLDRNIYKTLGWEYWFAPQQALIEHLLAGNTKGFNADAFHARQEQLRRFVARIGVDTPHAMSSADGNSITRRFGKWLGMIWRWNFTDSNDLQGFPWSRLAAEKPPAVRRELEYPVNQWTYIEVLLHEDLTRLCDQFRYDDCEHINRMTWQITLFNYQKISVELSFRHPYSLHRDMPGFDTAIYQARYIYDDLMRKLQARVSDLDLPESMPFIDWSIEVNERVLLAPELWDLFTAELQEIDYQQILALQNKLPLAFECYQSDACFYPEQSFTNAPIGCSEPDSFDHYPWSSSAVNKPLFFYQPALPIEKPGHVQRVFLERNSSQWWLGEDALQSIRDYYILKDQRGRSSWAYRTQDGDWFKQGEFY